MDEYIRQGAVISFYKKWRPSRESFPQVRILVVVLEKLGKLNPAVPRKARIMSFKLSSLSCFRLDLLGVVGVG